MDARLIGLIGTGRAAASGPSHLPEPLAHADGLVHATLTGMAAHPGLPLEAEPVRI